MSYFNQMSLSITHEVVGDPVLSVIDANTVGVTETVLTKVPLADIQNEVTGKQVKLNELKRYDPTKLYDNEKAEMTTLQSDIATKQSILNQAANK